MNPAGRAILTACLAFAPVAVAGNLAATPAFPGTSGVLWCCQARDKAAPQLPNPPAPPARTPATPPPPAGSRARRRRGIRHWLGLVPANTAPLPLGEGPKNRRSGDSLWVRAHGGTALALTRFLQGAPPFQEHPSPTGRGAGVAERGHFVVEGMRCAACMQTIEEGLCAVPGITGARASYSGQRATVSWDPTLIDQDGVIAAFASLGFHARAYDPAVSEAPMRALHDAWLMRLGVAGFGAAATMFLAEPLYYASAPTGADALYGQLLRVLGALVGTATGLYAAQPFLGSAWDGLKKRTLGMDTLVSMGAIATFLASVWGLLTRGPVYFDALLMLLFLLIGGRYAEAAMRRRAYGAMERLLGWQTTTCRVWRDGALETVPVAALAIGMEVELSPGEQVPADGVIVRGETHVSEAMLTGEPRPIAKRPGDEVLGGTQNAEGAVRVRLTRVGADAANARLEALVKEAAGGKSPLQRLADRAGELGTVAIAVIALLAAFGWLFYDPTRALPAAVAVLVATCPCALGLATPAARALALARALGTGVLVKRGDALEALAVVRHVVFDKTGTLTVGEPGVEAVLGGTDALGVAAALEAGSEHPLGRAIVAHARAAGLAVGEPPADFVAVAGRGVVGTVAGERALAGNAAWLAESGLVPPADWAAEAERLAVRGAAQVWVALGGRVLGLLALADRPRPEAAATVAKLRALGLGVTMLSGDGETAARAIAAGLGIDHVVAEATPQDKLDTIAALEARYGVGKVAMIGDGLNDAPALAAAGVGLAVARGQADLSVLAADVVLLGGGIASVPGTIALARRTVRVIHDNFRLSALYNAVAVPLAVVGLVTPLVAAVMMPASSLAVMASALRLARPGTGEEG